MKNRVIVISLMAFTGILICSGQAYAKAQDTDKIIDHVIENCELDENWTAYMAVYGHVNGDYLYFYRSLSTDRSVYRIGLEDYKLEKYISDIWTPKFIDNYIFYNAEQYNLYAKNLDTGRTRKLADDGSCRYVRKHENYIYYIDATENNKLCVYNTKWFFGLFGKKRIASEVNHYSDKDNNGLVIFKNRVYYAKFVRSPENFITGVAIYSCDLNGKDNKPVDTDVVLPTDGVLFLRNGELLFGYRDDAIEESENLYTYNALYRFDGKTFVNIGAAADYPQYDDRLSDGYHYMIGKLENGKPVYTEEGQLKVLRKDKKGKWTVFANTPFEILSLGGFKMQNGYLILLCDYGDGVDEIIIYDKKGNLIIDVPIAGQTDESYMEAKIVGEYVYIIHGEYAFDKLTYRTIDKCEIIKLTR